VLSWFRFRQGKWQRIVVDIGAPSPTTVRPEVS
jgi:hypothetical protein